MKLLVQAGIIAIACLAAPANADPQADADYIVSQAITKTMFEGAIAAQRPVIIGAIENNLRQQGITLPDPDRFFDLFMEEFLDEFTLAMQKESAPIYLDMFTPKQLNDIATFYRTPTGQAMIKATPDLMMSGAELGQRAGLQAGQNAGVRLAERIEREGLMIVEDEGLMSRLLDALR